MRVPLLSKWEKALPVRLRLRKGFLSEGVPVAVQGIAGPGAPHVFLFERRENTSVLPANVIDEYWRLQPHPRDVILRHLACTSLFFCEGLGLQPACNPCKDKAVHGRQGVQELPRAFPPRCGNCKASLWSSGRSGCCLSEGDGERERGRERDTETETERDRERESVRTG